jgi:hypothetical protein
VFVSLGGQNLGSESPVLIFFDKTVTRQADEGANSGYKRAIVTNMLTQLDLQDRAFDL